MTTDYNALRDDLASVLRDIPGVISVGIGKENKQIVLIVAIDPYLFTGKVPSSFKGVNVIIRDLGRAKLQRYGRLDHVDRHSTVKR
jgi:hypothetical protein